MAAVYEAYEGSPLERTVALKVLPPEFLHDDTFASRFMQEARVVANLEHPNIVPIYASGIDNGIPWISMRLLSGGSLATLLDQGRLGIGRTTPLLRDIANALDHAHDRGVIHRDLKPSNILMDDAGRAYICDFGLARLIEGRDRWTRTGIVAGTPHYMAPEQAFGAELDRRCDIYGLGVLAYEMLCGTTPFHGDSPVATLMQHANDPLPVPPVEFVPEPLFRSLKKALAKRPDDRWSTAGAFIGAFQAVAEAPAPARKHLVPALSLAALVILVVALLWSTSKMVGIFIPAHDTTLDSGSGSPESQSSLAGSDDPVVSPDDGPKSTTPSPDKGAARSKEGSVKSSASSQPTVNSKTPRPTDSDRDQRADGSPTSNGPLVGTPNKDLTSPATADDVQDSAETASAPGQRADDVTVGVDIAPAASDAALPATGPAVVAPASERETVAPPVRIWTVNPTYPDIAQAAQIEGNVIVAAVVGPDGRVTEVEVVRSVHPVLDEAARQAVLQFRYTPGLRNGLPASFKIQVPISFQLK